MRCVQPLRRLILFVDFQQEFAMRLLFQQCRQKEPSYTCASVLWMDEKGRQVEILVYCFFQFTKG